LYQKAEFRFFYFSIRRIENMELEERPENLGIQIIVKNRGTKGWLLMSFTIQPFNYVNILTGYRDSNEQ